MLTVMVLLLFPASLQVALFSLRDPFALNVVLAVPLKLQLALT